MTDGTDSDAVDGELVPHDEPRRYYQRGGVEFEPSERDRKVVEELAALGYSREQICLFILNPGTGKPIDPATLAKHFDQELEMGLLKANAIIGGVLFRKAAKGDQRAIEYWLDRRGGPTWKQSKTEPPPADEEGMSDEMVERARAKLEKMLAKRKEAEAGEVVQPAPAFEPAPVAAAPEGDPPA